MEAQLTNSFKNRLDKYWSDYVRMKASAAELIDIKYRVSLCTYVMMSWVRIKPKL